MSVVFNKEQIAVRFGAISPELVLRCALVPVAVALCYLSHWQWLRFLTSEANIRLDAWVGIHLLRLSPDQVFWHGVLYRYENACTFVDVWCGAIPLLWSLRRTFMQNAAELLTFGVCLFVFNVVRLSFSDFLFAHGLSWDLAHNVFGGVCYFLVLQWIIYRRRAEARD